MSAATNIELLRRLDPAASAAAHSDPVKEATLARILEEDTSRITFERSSRRGFLLSGAAVATVGVGVGVGLIGPSFWEAPVASAGTPRPLPLPRYVTGQPVLNKLNEMAQRAASTSDSSNVAMRWTVVGWYLSTQVPGNGAVTTSAVLPQRIETVPSASGFRRTVTYLPPTFLDDNSEARWAATDGQQAPDTRITIDELSSEAVQGSYWGPLPADGAEMRKWLQERHGYNGYESAVLDAITQLAVARYLGPADRAAVLSALTTVKPLTWVSGVVDRAGRAGEGFLVEDSASGLPVRTVLTFDADDGTLLSYEQVLTTESGSLNVRVPAVLAYETYLALGVGQ